MKALKVLGFIFCLILVGGLFETPSVSHVEPPRSVESVEQATPTDYTLEMPEIGLKTTMERIVKQGSELPVPDDVPGYYSANEHNLFIAGHNNKIFKQLDEMPSTLVIWQGGKPITYKLVSAETLPRETISMSQLFNFSGVVVMTCAGDYQNGTFSHRLILFYKA